MKNLLFFYFGLLKPLNFRRVLNFLLIEVSYILSKLSGRVFVFGRPWAASIEPTTTCNLRCTECPTGTQVLTRAKGTINIESFNTVLSKISPELIHLTLSFQGEPFLNPCFSEMVQLAKQERIFVCTSTNGHFLNNANIGSIIQSGLDHLIISMDGINQQTYEKYRVNGNLQTVTDGISQLVAEKKAAQSLTPFIELQFLVFRHNEQQIRQMKEYASRSGVDKLTFKTAQVYNLDKSAVIIPSSERKSRYRQLPDNTWVIARKLKNRCHRIWRSVVVTWDGEVVPCCFDKNADHRTGNLLEDSLDNIWKNKAYYSFRNQVLHSRAYTEICRNCGE